jgi:glycosyltransferase involved in cell wall biosynthesis
MPLTVLSVAYAFAPVGPDAVGGAEQILSNLDQALHAAGHTSLVVACEGSRPSGKLFAAPQLRDGLDDTANRRRARQQFQAAFDRALSTQYVDLIHIHGLDFYEYTLPPEIPVLVTLHLPIAWYPKNIWASYPSRIVFQCVSHTQRQSCPPELCDCPVIPNGVASCAPAKKTSDFAIALGRLCPEKNLHAALEAGSLANTRVLLGGEVFPYCAHREYFSHKVEPLLARKGHAVKHEFLGPLSFPDKQQLLRQAKCLLHPTLAPETSSLVAMEALAAGTPVIAYRSGALPEIVEDGVTGFLVDSVEEMSAAIHRVHTIDREVCRAAAQRRFSRERMVQEYFYLYHAMVGRPLQEKLYA